MAQAHITNPGCGQASQETPEQLWLKHVRIWFPDYRSRTYFLPSIHVSHVSYSVAVIAGQQVLVPQEPQEEADQMLSPAERKRSRRRRSLSESSSTNISSAQWPRHRGTFGGQKAVLGKDARDDRALQSLLKWLHRLVESAETHKGMIVVSQLEFGKYLHKPTYAAAADRLPRPSNINIENYRQGDFDLLIIHSEFGLITFEIKSVGANFRELKMTEQNEDVVVLKKARQAIKQLNKAEAVLKHLVSDLPNVCVTKILVMPNVQFSQFVRVICNSSQDSQDLCKCLSAKSIDDAMKLCLLSDQLSDRTAMCDTALPAIRNLNAWWRQIFDDAGTQPNLAPNVYEILVARFCGPGTTVEVHCDIPTQNAMRTEGEGVFVAGEIMNRIVLFPEQVNLLNRSPLNVFLTGPPGTGKTVVLILQGMIWLQRGHSVHVVSTCSASRAVAIAIERQLQKSSKASSESPSVRRHQFDLNKEGEHDETPAALLKSLSKDRLLCIIADEAGPDREHFTKFYDELLQHVPGVCLWAASVHHGVRPLCMEEVKMTFPLRSPPYVVDEVKKSVEIKNGHVLNYSPSEAHTPTDGPMVETITHLYDTSGHRGDSPHDCLQCGSEVAAILKRLGISSADVWPARRVFWGVA